LARYIGESEKAMIHQNMDVNLHRLPYGISIAVEMPDAPYRFASHPYLMNHRTFLNSYKIPTSSLLYQSHSDKKKIWYNNNKSYQENRI
jgi:hypothetical protein